jgi:hypothetical protein
VRLGRFQQQRFNKPSLQNVVAGERLMVNHRIEGIIDSLASTSIATFSTRILEPAIIYGIITASITGTIISVSNAIFHGCHFGLRIRCTPLDQLPKMLTLVTGVAAALLVWLADL